MVTKRTAKVAIRNEKSEPLLAVSVAHKYSDEYKHNGKWPIVQPGELSDATLEVEYNTGFLTTGVDWWGLSWYSPDMKTVYYTDPNNFRDIIDTLERIAPTILELAPVAVELVSAPSGPGAAAAGAAAEAVAQATAEFLFNTETTDGFKRHMLTSDDEGEVTEIVIKEDNTVEFRSNSGTSKTVTSTRDV